MPDRLQAFLLTEHLTRLGPEVAVARRLLAGDPARHEGVGE